jgi:hypothetical protein
MFPGYSSKGIHLYRRVLRSLHVNSMQELDWLGTIYLTPLNPNNRRSQSLSLEGPKLERTHPPREHLIQLLECAVFHLRQDEGHPDGSDDGERSVHEPDFALEVAVTFVLHIGVDEGDQDANGEAAEGTDCDCLFAELEGRGFCCYYPDADVMLVLTVAHQRSSGTHQDDHPKACANCQMNRQASAPFMLSGLLS